MVVAEVWFVVRLPPLLGNASARPLESAAQCLLQVGVEAPECLLRHTRGGVRL